jgi:Uma2 family endonuclease
LAFICYNWGMSQATHRVTPSIPEEPRIPPLENGDHLTRDEFERRYDATPGLKKAELIEGRVYITPAVPMHAHAAPHAELVGLLGVYKAATPGTCGGNSGHIRLDSDNMPQPDACLLIQPSYGGQSNISADDYLEGAPELIGEITYNSASYDLHEKFRLYRRHGVREYIVWRTRDREFDHFVIRQTEYQRVSAVGGLLRSEVFPGLCIDTAALLDNNLALALKSLQQGIDSPEHQTFIAALRQRAGQTGPAKPL